MSKVIPEPVIAAIKEIRSVKIITTDCYILATSPSFNIRVMEFDPSIVMEKGERKWVVQFGYKPTFDRWANSVNFETEIWFSPEKNRRYLAGLKKGEIIPQYTIPNMNKEISWCKKVATSGLFDWNTYFWTIKTPWFIHEK